jgi:plasmid stabilization system protein ParE
MKSIITNLANEQIRQIAKYIHKEFGKDRRDEFMKEVRQTRRLIEGSPNIGPVEPLLADRAVMYRSYVMNRLDKIVYRIDGDIIYIVAFWDVRRDPGTLVSEVK